MADFKKQFRAARRAATPLVAIRTADPWSAVNQITSALNGKAEETPIMVWDLVRGLRGVTKPGAAAATELLDGADPAEATARPFDLLLRLSQLQAEGSIVVMMNAHKFLEDVQVMQAVWNLRDTFKTKFIMFAMTMTVGARLPLELIDDVLVIDEPLPTPEVLQTVLRGIIKARGLEALDEATEAKAVDAVAGLAGYPAEQAISMSTTKKDGLDLDGLWERKRQTIEQQAGMTIKRGDAPEPVGLDNARKFLRQVLAGRKKYRSILFVDEIEKAFAGTGTDLSGVKTGMTGTWCSWVTETQADGILCIGVPGGGKTMLASWAGSVAGIPTIDLDFGGLQSSLVGSTEERIRTALKTVNGVAQGSVLIIATCNGIGQMPPEILRRFNLGTFFFDLMSEPERDACWKAYRSKYEIDAKDAKPKDEGWTGAEIRECCKIAYQLRISLKESGEFIVPVSRSSADKVKALRQSATGKYISASAPGVYRWTDVAGQEGSSTGRRFAEVEETPYAFDRKGRKA
jgi:hypothetical protein